MAGTMNFFDIFKKYDPDEEKRELLLSIRDFGRQCVKYTKSGEPLRVEVSCNFPQRCDAELIYEIEDECRAVYGALSFKIMPHFPPESFSVKYMREIVCEAVFAGAVTQGFFNNAQYDDDGETIYVRIPFLSDGVSMVNSVNTGTILENIIKSRYGVSRRVVITSSDDAEARREERQRSLKAILAEADAESARRAKAAAEEAARLRKAEEEDKPEFKRISGISPLTGTFRSLSDGVYSVGASTYDVRDAELIYGSEFDIGAPTPLSDVTSHVNSTVIMLGTVFEVNGKESRNGDTIQYNIGISDGASGIYLKLRLKTEDNASVAGIKPGVSVAVQAKLLVDKFDGEICANLRSAKKISKLTRVDNAEEKRVELHLHTNMSAMDALITPEELVKTAVKWGHKAIAVTDHGNVQAYPEIMLELEKSGSDLKIIYGIEGYFVNDTARAVFGNKRPAFSDEMVVFDIETTGLSNRTCGITEIGAVIIKDGEIIDTFNTFVNPEMHIPEEITKLTSIDDDMVKDAPLTEEAVRAFLDFAGDRMLIAHNAGFDIGFIRVAAEKYGIEFGNTYLDTVPLSKYVNPELKKHKLDTIAEYYGLGDFNHHRACDDAAMLAAIFFEMQSRLRSEGIYDFDRVVDAMSERSDPLKLPMNHIIILVKNADGLKNLYQLVSRSYLDFYRRNPRMPKSVIERYRDGLIIGSACEAGELFSAVLNGRSDSEIEEIAEFYDYLEIQPICNNRFLIDEGRVRDEEGLRDLNRRIVALGKKLGKPVVATCDAHFLNKEDEIYRKILLAGMKYHDADRDTGIYLRTTDEMLEEFMYLGEETAREVVIENPGKIADMVERIRPIPKGRYEPDIPGSDEELSRICWERAHEFYGDKLPEIVEKRLDKELSSIIKNGFAVLYMIAQKLVAYSESLGYLVGSRGSVGSSFVATMSGISEVNPLPPHYRCPKCRYSEFITDGSVGSGFDLPDKSCPICGTAMLQDGHDIPFETFLGFYGDKSPDIDLNFSGDVQGKVHKYTEDLFGEGHVFRAGTIGTLADKTAWGYVNKYLEEREISLPKAEISHLASRCVGIKRTTGQHPGGIIVVPKDRSIYDFTPVQHPADDPMSSIITTHFQFSYLHDTILKLDELGHDIPTKYKVLERYTNTSVMDVKMNDKSVYELFLSTKPLGITPDDIGGCKLGTYGLPEMGTHFIQQVLLDAKPKNFADLLQISGLTHGTNVWLGNAQDLIKAGICDISEVVGTRDGIMLYLIRHGLDNSMAFKIMEDVRKGKGLKPEYEKEMLAHDVPEWYIGSCKKIKYMFPKAHAAAYVMSAIRLGWYKIYYPLEFYAAFLTVAPGGFDAEIVGGGLRNVNATIRDIEGKGNEATQKEADMLTTLYLVRECLARGIKFKGVDLYRSDSSAFLPEDGYIRMPFNSLGGLGDAAAQKITEVRDEGEIFSVEELRQKTGISKAVIEILRRNHVLDNLSETNQFSLF